MLCPKCKLEAGIQSAREEAAPEGTATVQTFVCRNPQCENFGKTVAEGRYTVTLSEENS